MELQGKTEKESAKRMFEKRLDGLLARGKQKPIVPRKPSASFYSSYDASIRPSQNSEMDNPIYGITSASNLNTQQRPFDSSRQLLVRELIERRKSSRRQSLPSRNNPETREGQPPGAVVTTAHAITPSSSSGLPPDKPPTPKKRTHRPLLPAVPLSPISQSMPDLSPPTSPDLINFPSEDSEDEDTQTSSENVGRSMDMLESALQCFPNMDETGQTNSDSDENQSTTVTPVESITSTDEVVVSDSPTENPGEDRQESVDAIQPEPAPAQSRQTRVARTESILRNFLPEYASVSGSGFTSSESNLSLISSELSLWENPHSEHQDPEAHSLDGASASASEVDVSVLSRASSSSSGISSVSYDSTPGGLKISDKIIWFTDNGVPEAGEVKWIGKINDRFHAGVEFKNPVGNSSGKIKGRQIFTCALTHGRFVPVCELMFFDDYYHGLPINNEPSPFSNGMPGGDRKSVSDSIPFVCVICQDDLLTRNEQSKNKEDKQMVATMCGHLFHSDCLYAWFKLKPKLQQPCPYCQRIMNISDTIRIFPVQGKM